MDTLDFPYYCLLIATGSYATCSQQFNKAVALYFAENEPSRKRKQVEDLNDQTGKRPKYFKIFDKI